MTAGDPMVREYRRRADECRAQVEKTKGENEKGKWRTLAAKWTTLPRTRSAGKRIEGCLGRTRSLLESVGVVIGFDRARGGSRGVEKYFRLISR